MPKLLQLELDRRAKTPLAEQIRNGISNAIQAGVLPSGARLPSWQDLAAQLGVARGTVRSAYEKLSAAQLIVASRATGTHVAPRPPIAVRRHQPPSRESFMDMYRDVTARPGVFRMGIPAQETFPAKLFSRIRSRATRAEAGMAPMYPDPSGERELRQEIAAYLAIARGIECSPSQIIVTGGFSSGLGLALRVLGLEGRKVWAEDPGFPFTRRGLELAKLAPVPVPVDGEGIDVDYGLRYAPDAALVVVTPGQQAPLGSTLSLARRLRLLDWAEQEDSWVIEDDYLSELQLDGRAAPALASIDPNGRVIHIGSYSKTISPALRLGFLVAPLQLASRFAEVAMCLAPAPGRSVQLATAEFMREGHYIRHLRRAKRLYSAQRDALLKCLRPRASDSIVGGLAVVLRLPNGAPDVAIAKEALTVGLAPTPLSLWYASQVAPKSGLLLSVATAQQKHVAESCDRLFAIIDRCT